MLAFAERVLPRAADLWVQASLDQRQWFQHLFFPEGISFDGNGFVRTAVTGFSYLRPIEVGNEGLAAQTGIEPNLVAVIDASCQQQSHNSDEPPSERQ